MRTVPIHLFALATLLASATTLQAQNSASASVTASVQTPITVTKTQDLAFGIVFPGVNKIIAVTDAGAAAFTVGGQASAGINLSFTLPASISSGANTLPIASWTARTNTTNSSASGTDFPPSASAVGSTFSVLGALYFFIGATSQPAVSQPSGSYSGTMTMTVVYP